MVLIILIKTREKSIFSQSDLKWEKNKGFSYKGGGSYRIWVDDKKAEVNPSSEVKSLHLVFSFSRDFNFFFIITSIRSSFERTPYNSSKQGESWGVTNLGWTKKVSVLISSVRAPIHFCFLFSSLYIMPLWFQAKSLRSLETLWWCPFCIIVLLQYSSRLSEPHEVGCEKVGVIDIMMISLKIIIFSLKNKIIS